MAEYRSIQGEIKLLERNNDFLFPVELWLLNDKVNRNNWQFVNLEEHRTQWAGVPILVAYVNNGRTTGDGHNQRTKTDKNGQEYQSFVAADAERICGALSDNPDDIRLEERDGALWTVGRGALWAWYSHELCLQIAEWAQQGRTMSVSIEALVTKSYMDGDVEVETNYTPLGVTCLGAGVAPAVEDAHIAMLAEIADEFKELKLRAASYIEQPNADPKPQNEQDPQNNPTPKGVIHSMRLSKTQLRELSGKFEGYTVLGAEQSDDGIVVGLEAAGETAIYKMAALDETVCAEKIQKVNAQVHFCTAEGDEVIIDACDLIESANAKCVSLSARLETAETALAQANEKVEQMVTAENARRLSAAKAKATATLDAFNAHRDTKIDAKLLEALTKDIEDGKFTACTDESGAWIGEQIVSEKVLSLCATAVMEQDKKKATEPMTWGSIKQASAAPGTVGELFATKKH